MLAEWLKVSGLLSFSLVMWLIPTSIKLQKLDQAICLVASLTSSLVLVEQSRQLIPRSEMVRKRDAMLQDLAQTELALETFQAEQQIKQQHLATGTVGTEPVTSGTDPAPKRCPAPSPEDVRHQLERLYQLPSEDSGANGTNLVPGTESTSSGTNLVPGTDPVPELAPSTESESSDAAIDEISDEELRKLILSYRLQNVTSQNAFILECWGISKGSNSARYQKAKARYQAVCRKFGL